jgi:hypothetical protein
LKKPFLVGDEQLKAMAAQCFGVSGHFDSKGEFVLDSVSMVSDPVYEPWGAPPLLRALNAIALLLESGKSHEEFMAGRTSPYGGKKDGR